MDQLSEHPRLARGRSILAVGRFVFDRAFADPVREGRLKETAEHPWPRGVRAIVIAAYGLFVVLALAVAGSTGLRLLPLLADGDVSLPWVAVPVLLIAVVVALSLLYVAALHIWWPLRLAILGVLTLALVSLPAVGPAGTWVNVAGAALLILFAVLRARRAFSVWEFVFALFVFGHLLVLRLAGPLVIGVEHGGMQVSVIAYWGTLLTVFATPAVIMAGAAMTELVVRAGSWTARGIGESVLGRPRPRLLGGLLLGVLIAWSLAQETWGLVTDPRRDLSAMPIAALVLGVVAVVALGVLRLAPHGDHPGVPVDPDDVADAYGPISWPLAFLLAGWVFIGVLTTLIDSILGTDLELGRWVTWTLFVAGGLAVGIREVRRSRPAAALIAVVLAVSSPFAQVLLMFGWGTPISMLITVEVIAAVLLLGWLLVTRTLTADRAIALAGVLLLSRLHQFRELLAEPLVAVFALSGTSAALLVGLVWRQLTEYAGARGDSARFPNPSRLLLSLANVTMISLAIALFALAGEAGVTDLALIEGIGDGELGGALLHAAMLAGLLLALRGRERVRPARGYAG
ncbi:hypothetical protein AADG42_19075 [Ammonicoccus fulvus]|uniref:DUF2157 domain-containing protein n=1 Tax=Ammonicoccus fulvus TaxID=3138240 RepID=A0ABZ3FX14_9ACTN